MRRYLLLIGILVFLVSCSSDGEKENVQVMEIDYDLAPDEHVQDYPSYQRPKEVEWKRDSLLNVLDSKIIVPTVSSGPYFRARNAEQAYDEGLAYGREDGEEDGMNNDPEFSFDDSNPYRGQMAAAYRDGYREGYDEGLEDGQEEYDLTRQPGEEETEW